MLKFASVLLFLLFISLIIYNYFPYQGLPKTTQIDSLVVIKSKKKLLTYSSGKIVKTFRVALGGIPIGPKHFEGDEKTPEGNYIINDKNPNSDFHKNLGISYPNKKDIDYAQKLHKSPGGAIKIHGLKNGLGLINRFHRLFNWTNGCIALTNKEIDDLYIHVNVGIPIIIYP